MAKKNIRSDNAEPLSSPATPERRRTARATTRTSAASPTVPIAEPDGSPAVARETAEDRTQRDNARADDSSGAHRPTYEQIAEAAYHRYLARGGAHGYDLDDWVEAERSLAGASRSE